MNQQGTGPQWPRYRWFDRIFDFPVPMELFPDILERLRGTPARLEERLRGAAAPETGRRTARHPGLGTPMTVTDLAFFVAEHDDHHLARITRILEAA